MFQILYEPITKPTNQLPITKESSIQLKHIFNFIFVFKHPNIYVQIHNMYDIDRFTLTFFICYTLNYLLGNINT